METPIIKRGSWHYKMYERHYLRTHRVKRRRESICHYTHVVVGEALYQLLVASGAVFVIAALCAVAAYVFLATGKQRLHIALVVLAIVGLTVALIFLVLAGDQIGRWYRKRWPKAVKPSRARRSRSPKFKFGVDPGLVLGVGVLLALFAWYVYAWVRHPMSVLQVHLGLFAIGLLIAALAWIFTRDAVKDTGKVVHAYLKARKLKVCPFVEFE